MYLQNGEAMLNIKICRIFEQIKKINLFLNDSYKTLLRKAH